MSHPITGIGQRGTPARCVTGVTAATCQVCEDDIWVSTLALGLAGSQPWILCSLCDLHRRQAEARRQYEHLFNEEDQANH